MGAPLKYPRIPGESADDRRTRLRRERMGNAPREPARSPEETRIANTAAQARYRMKRGIVPFTAEQKAERCTATKQWRSANPAKWALISRNASRKFKYGVTPEQFRQMFENQEGLCGICSRLMTMQSHRDGKKGPDPRVACIDHDHATGDVRGLLCLLCNAALGKFQDSTRILHNAIGYLETAPKSAEAA